MKRHTHVSNARNHLVKLETWKDTCSVSIAHPQWSENPHLLRMWEVIQPSTPLEDAHGHPHLGESSQMCRMRRFIWWGWATETAHAHSQWGEATQVHTMRLCMSTGNHSKKAHQNTFLTKASQINANCPTSLQWQDSISTNIYSTTAEKNHTTIVGVGAHSLKHNIWKATSAFTYQCTKCSFSSAQSSNLKQHMIRHSTAVD